MEYLNYGPAVCSCYFGLLLRVHHPHELCSNKESLEVKNEQQLPSHGCHMTLPTTSDSFHPSDHNIEQ